MKVKTFILTIFCASLLLPACKKQEEPRARFNVDRARIVLISTGVTSTGERATFTVVANKGYTVESDADWLATDRTEGVGRQIVTVYADAYPEGTGREATLTVRSGEASRTVTVVQNDDPFPAYGYVYFEDGFDWLLPYARNYGSGDSVGTNDAGATANNIFGSCPDVAEEFGARGYADTDKAVNRVLYLQPGYLKFGKTAYHNGLVLPPVDLKATGENSTDAKLTFNWCAQMSGTGNVDNVQLVVELRGGEGQVALNGGGLGKVSSPLYTKQLSGKFSWQDASVNIYGLDAATRIVIRPLNYDKDTPTLQRFYLDNLSLVKIPKNNP